MRTHLFDSSAVTSPSSPALGVPIRVLLREPDAASRNLILSLLERESELAVDCVDDSQLLCTIEEYEPELVILDLNTPAIRGAQGWEALRIRAPLAMILTSYDPASVSAFASAAIDLLIKPFDAERFGAAICLAKSKIIRERLESVSGGRLRRLQDGGVPPPQFLHRLAVEAGDRIVLVRVSEIEWMMAAGNHTRLHLGKTSYLLRRSMKSLHARLDPTRFLRVHRSAIVNLDHVEEFHLPPRGNMFVKLSDGLCLPLRRGSRMLLRRLLKNTL